MLNKVNPIVKELEIPGIRYFSNLVSTMENGINLTVGEPDFTTPESVKQAGADAIFKNKTGYSHNAGLIALREEVAAYFAEKYGFSYQSEDEIIITNGASEGIDSVLRTILVSGDEVIILAPSYPAYESLVQLNGGKVVYLDTTETNFKPDPKILDASITDKTKAVILNYPSNPTGMTLDREEVAVLVEVLERHNVFVIADEIYSENTFHQKHVSLAEYPSLRDVLFLIQGLSKSHAMTGWRIGFLLGSMDVMREVLKVHLNNAICASLPSQYASIEALKNNRHAPERMTAAYYERCLYVEERLRQIGIDVIRPTGAFYIFPYIGHFEKYAYNFAMKLLEDQKVAVVPGSSFSEYGEGFIRISFASSMEQLEEAMNRMTLFINKHYKQ